MCFREMFETFLNLPPITPHPSPSCLRVGRQIDPTSALPEVFLSLSLMWRDRRMWRACRMRGSCAALHGHINKGAAQSYPPGPLSVGILIPWSLMRDNAPSEHTLCNNTQIQQVSTVLSLQPVLKLRISDVHKHYFQQSPNC